MISDVLRHGVHQRIRLRGASLASDALVTRTQNVAIVQHSVEVC